MTRKTLGDTGLLGGGAVGVTMNGRLNVSKLLSATPLTGMPMLLCVVAVLIAPTLIVTSLDGALDCIGFAPFLPFVLLSALVLKWEISAGVAAASASLGDFLVVGPKYQLLEGPSDIFGVAVFACAAAFSIGLAHAFRKVVAAPIWINGPKGTSSGIVFSQEGGHVYASWYGARSFVPMGPEAEVAAMMQDFLAQRELGKRLASRSSVEHGGSDA